MKSFITFGYFSTLFVTYCLALLCLILTPSYFHCSNNGHSDLPVNHFECRKQYNFEFQFNAEDLLPVPLSVFVNKSAVWFIFTVRDNQGDFDVGVAHPKGNFGLIPSWKKWLNSYWRTTFCQNGKLRMAKCFVIGSNYELASAEVLAIRCNPKNQLDNVTRFNISSIMFHNGKIAWLRNNNLLGCKRESAIQNYTVGVCSLLSMKHISRIHEFIIYHRIIGIDKFIFYLNMMPGEMERAQHFLQKYLDKGLVDLVPYWFEKRPFTMGIQHPSSTDCLLRARGKIKWIGLFDVDEFVTFPPSTKFVTIPQMLAKKQSDNPNFATMDIERFNYAPINAEEFRCECKFSFINEWLWRQIVSSRPGKAFHNTDRVIYAGAHFALIPFFGEKLVMKQREVIFAHYRYPPRFDGNQTFMSYLVYSPAFKELYGSRVASLMHNEVNLSEIGTDCCSLSDE